MIEDRETIDIVTPEKEIPVQLRAWITGREKQKIDGAMFSGIRTSGDGKNISPKFSESMIADQENAAIAAVVVGVNGNNTDILNRVLNMRVRDFEFVLDQVQKIVEGDLPEKKETSSETNTTKSSNEEQEQSQTTDSE